MSKHVHHFNEAGTEAVCSAPADAQCRARTKCDSETWNIDGGCVDHDGRHPVQPGSKCWMVEWINATDLPESHANWQDPPEIIPGAAIVIEFIGSDEGCCWSYTEATP